MCPSTSIAGVGVLDLEGGWLSYCMPLYPSSMALLYVLTILNALGIVVSFFTASRGLADFRECDGSCTDPSTGEAVGYDHSQTRGCSLGHADKTFSYTRLVLTNERSRREQRIRGSSSPAPHIILLVKTVRCRTHDVLVGDDNNICGRIISTCWLCLLDGHCSIVKSVSTSTRLHLRLLYVYVYVYVYDYIYVNTACYSAEEYFALTSATLGISGGHHYKQVRIGPWKGYQAYIW
ncbi:hypothetical protein BJ875DRAFT_236220 [Amylocarpus encephaloides]|uniref:Uncharacterized protein n=1 Tax=Amylocarpus encephaloides TaxID=45428 RepID=A0A9P7Y8F4_9HELO|nr:hypothetical protein BJ875DRAFT_236220 [Amylocarpus encephaloides]